MLSLNDLSQAVSAYLEGNASLDEFADWFRIASRARFGEDADVLDACVNIDERLSELHYGDIDENKFRDGLKYLLPFVLGPVYSPAREIVIGMPRVRSRSVNLFVQLVAAVLA